MKTTDKNTTSESSISTSSEASKIESLLASDESQVSSTDALKVLRYFWPTIFNISTPKPLKIGIHKDIAEAKQIPEWLISKALQFFTSRDEYLKQIKHGNKRINLTSGNSGTVRLKEAVDAETKRYYQSSGYKPQRRTFLVTKAKLVSTDTPNDK